MLIPVIKIETEKNPDVFIRTDKKGYQQIMAKYCITNKVTNRVYMNIEESEYLKGKLK